MVYWALDTLPPTILWTLAIMNPLSWFMIWIWTKWQILISAKTHILLPFYLILTGGPNIIVKKNLRVILSWRMLFKMAFRCMFYILEFGKKNHGDPYYEPTIVVHDTAFMSLFSAVWLAVNYIYADLCVLFKLIVFGRWIHPYCFKIKDSAKLICFSLNMLLSYFSRVEHSEGGTNVCS